MQLAVVSMIPQGYMIDVPGNQATIVICTGDGLVTIPDPQQHEDDQSERTLCSFSMNAQPVLAAAVSVVPVETPSLSGPAPVYNATAFSIRLFSSAQPRAPPVA